MGLQGRGNCGNELTRSGNGESKPTDGFVHQFIENQIKRTPHATALMYDNKRVTYFELGKQTNQLARFLNRLGLKPEMRVAICGHRGLETIIGILGILKAGPAYVPLDPAYPGERLAYMLKDSSPELVLVGSNLSNDERAILKEATNGASLIDLHSDARAWEDELVTDIKSDLIGLTPTNLAYIIYTSGSTGRPKGVMVEHRGLCNLAVAQRDALLVDENSRILQFSSPAFDASVFELTMALCWGGSLCIPRSDTVLVGRALAHMVNRHKITHVTLPPAIISSVPDGEKFDSVRVLISAGEDLPKSLVERWAGERRLINAYGPTEATVCATWTVCGPGGSDKPSIGYAIPNVRVYILDERGRPVSGGETGELYIGGFGVARGYLNRPGLTAERFVPDPFCGISGARMFRTGDLASFSADGLIYFLGRVDFQVKLRGFRIELGEIEAVLSEHPAIYQAIVLIREDRSGEKRLTAYYIKAMPYSQRDSDAALSRDRDSKKMARTLHDYLSSKLPKHMVPSAYVCIDALPLTTSGKLDRNGLPEPGHEAYPISE
ncbi:amino acid adenylation domain-containing protein [Inquilinus limosus]|uniref:non-ribosomal peptide synthetase n=1 Tax=Inquilinus limosus TaxID=171674 RepID=UPI003F181CE4